MRKIIVCGALAMAVIAAHAQTPTQAPAKPAPPVVTAQTPAELTSTEQTALTALAQQAQQLQEAQKQIQQRITAVANDIRRAHPGYQFNLQTGKLEPVPASPPAPATNGSK